MSKKGNFTDGIVYFPDFLGIKLYSQTSDPDTLSDMSLSFRDDPKEAQGYTSSANFDIIIRHNWNVDVNIPISVGDLLFFPSYLLHKPNINQTNLNRISFACNLMPSILQRPHSQPWSMDLKL